MKKLCKGKRKADTLQRGENKMGIYQKMGRRWISLLLVFLMVFSLVPVDELMQVFAAEKPAITVGWKPQKKEVPSGENGEITLKVEIDPAQVEDVGLQIPPDRGGGSGIRRVHEE